MSADELIVFESSILKKKRRRNQGFAKRHLVLHANGQLSYSVSARAPARETCSVGDSSIGLVPASKEFVIDSGRSIWRMRCLMPQDYEDWLNAFRSCHATVNEQRKQSLQMGRGTADEADQVSGRDFTAISEALDQPIQDLEEMYAAFKQADSDHSHNQSKIKSLFGARRPSSARSDALSPNHISAPSSSPQLSNQNPLEIAQPQQYLVKLSLAIEILQNQQTELRKLAASLPTAPRSTSLEGIKEMDPVAAIRYSSAISRVSSIDAQSTFDDGESVFVDAPQEYEFEPADTDEHGQDESIVAEADDFQSVASSPTLEKSSPLRTNSGHVVVKRRTKLPAGVTGDEVSLFSILKKAVGKDLSRISMPISFNEPLSALQRLAEELECTALLREAAETQDSVERICLICAFVISGFASSRYRTSRKPFNPLLGETFECLRPDKGLLFVAEKVSHRPVVLAAHAEDPDKKWVLDMTAAVAEKFYGRSLEFTPNGKNQLKLTALDETYSWQLPNTYLRNIMAGQKFIEYVGELIVTSSSGCQATVEFHSGSMFAGESGRNKLSGTVQDAHGETVCKLIGRWDESFARSSDAHSKTWRELWRHAELQGNPALQYGFGPFAIELNEITSDVAACLPPTDSRLRPDQRAFEDGNLEKAEDLKLALEERQRARRDEIEAKGLLPRWFTQDGDTFQFKQEAYFKARDAADWQDEVAIFST